MIQMHVAALQQSFSDDIDTNIDRVEALVREAASRGAKVILPSELFEGHYFCKVQSEAFFARAQPVESHKAVLAMRKLAKELGVYIPTSFYERDGQHYYNSLAMIDDAGEVMGVYRKSHIPDGPGYSEKYYFNPGDTGFCVWDTAVGRVGLGICWDQWFPECARVLALRGAEIILYPTAIGSEPHDSTWDSRRHWQRVMQGHAGANLVPVVAANRFGVEKGQQHQLTFYGTSFIAGPTGEIVTEAGRDDETVLTATFDLDAVAELRHSWGVFRDRRPELYRPLWSLDGHED